MVDFADSAKQATFRAQVEVFIDNNLPELLRGRADQSNEEGRDRPDSDERAAAMKQWRQALISNGWIAPSWPKEYGGSDLSVMEQYILSEAFAEKRAPRLGIPNVGSTIMVHGSDEMKKQHLPGMVSGETRWCQGYSEPGSGSDLASLQTRAVRDGDDYVINGQKIWTSGAHLASWMFALVRTDPDAPKHRGITYMLLPMDTPGITVRPLVQMSDARGFNEVFFEDVRVSAKNVIGEENRGWYVGATHLDFERSSIGSAVGHLSALGDLTAFLAEEEEQGSGRSMLSRSNPVRHELADRYVEANVAKTLSQRVITLQNRYMIPNYEASMTKVFSTELDQRVARTATKALGLYGGLFDENDKQWTPMGRRWSRLYLSTVAATIGGGTSEIQRNVIATRGLGLPRG